MPGPDPRATTGTAMQITLMVCDHATVAEGKLYINGGAWTNCWGPRIVGSLALAVEVPWNEANRRIPIVVSLLDADGQPVQVSEAEGQPSLPMVLDGAFEVGRPPGLPAGTPLPFVQTFPFAIPLPLGRYVWQVEIDKRHVASQAFTVISAPVNLG